MHIICIYTCLHKHEDSGQAERGEASRELPLAPVHCQLVDVARLLRVGLLAWLGLGLGLGSGLGLGLGLGFV